MRYGGRAKGVKNKDTQELYTIAARCGKSPFEILCLIANADWKALGYDGPQTIVQTKQGGRVMIDRINIVDRREAASEAAQYMYPKRKAIEVDATVDLDANMTGSLTKQQVEEALKKDAFTDDSDTPEIRGAD
jgi:hypothetical protein